MARKFSELGKFDDALNYYERVRQRNQNDSLVLEACRESSQILQYQKKEYSKAVEAYRYIILKSKDLGERHQAQKAIADIYFNNLQDYKNAIAENSKLLNFELTPYERSQIHLSMARSNFYLNNFFQAESEVDMVLSIKANQEQIFEAQIIKSNLALSQKRYKQSIQILSELLKSEQTRAINANIPITIAMCYEELNDFKTAMETLKKFQEYYPAKKDFLELRLKKLKERQQNLPGARGLRK